MNISLNTPNLNNKTSNGYGYAAHNIVSTLRLLGHQVERNNPDSDVQLFFSQPDYFWQPRDSTYNIAYTPWESSGVPSTWIDAFNEMDEVWTTSDLCAKWYLDAGVTKPIKVYEHGIEDIWKPVRRRSSGRIRFLHIGEPAPRKGGQLALDAFRRAFATRRDVHLTLKAQTHNTTRVYEDSRRGERVRSIIGLPDDFQNIETQTGELTLPQLVSLYQDHDVLIYPSWGEGFGFIPLQALSTGMPTICTGAWAPYRRFLSPLDLNSTEYESPWPDIHPGNMVKPDIDHLVSLMRQAADDFESLADHYWKQAPAVLEAYDWKTLTRNAFAHLENK